MVQTIVSSIPFPVFNPLYQQGTTPDSSKKGRKDKTDGLGPPGRFFVVCNRRRRNERVPDFAPAAPPEDDGTAVAPEGAIAPFVDRCL